MCAFTTGVGAKGHARLFERQMAVAMSNFGNVTENALGSMRRLLYTFICGALQH